MTMHGGSRRASWNQEANGPLLSLHAQPITRGSAVCYLNLQHDHAPSWATQPCTPTVNARRAVQ